MSPRTYFLISFVIPVLARKIGGGGVHHGGVGGHGHSYPPSPGLSGTHNHGSYVNAGHTYGGHPNPSKTGASYPYSETGLSGNGKSSQGTQHKKTDVHHHYNYHYHYNPPQQINYGSTYHPVYHGAPPTYIYEYRDSGSRFDTLLTGLALYNLGRMSSGSYHHHYNSEYHGNPGEKCKFAIYKDNGDYEETRIDCKLMSSFIWEYEKTPNSIESSKPVAVTNIENTVTINNDSSVTRVQNKTVVVEDALKVKGPSILVAPGMRCYMIRISRDSSMMRKQVDCGLLQTYAMTSFRSNSSRNISVITSLITFSCVLRLLQ
ncbi:uncharacterized protein LOC113231197 [Hyposmocoma kahamanoa]|uniref:uncharacterized protein LOC113231197 n=1 Tax=Hyposmocoma kahamanoa TaxID=1477025 RepID=UPI000E6D9CD8|nr:uncharacterized protein LOC113231197 [Hyposmocoma kahamanoa]